MREPAAIIAPAIDIAQVSREIARAHVAWQDGERKLEASEKKSESIRDEQRERRLELGRLLIRARAEIKHGGWLPYLEKMGIEDRTARKWMQEAGWVEEQSKTAPYPNEADLNSRVASGVDKRPRKSPEQADDDNDEDDDAMRQIRKLCSGLIKAATKMADQDRFTLAESLRETADILEGKASINRNNQNTKRG